MIEKNITLSRVLFHLAVLVVGTLLFVFVFALGLFRSQPILFYRGILVLSAACFILACGLMFLQKHYRLSHITSLDICYAVLFCFLGNLVFFTHLPVTADRSVSVFLLGYMDAQTRPVSVDQLSQALIYRYVQEGKAVEKRVDEQIRSGTLAQVDGQYEITPRGRLLVKFYLFIADVFGISRANLLPY